MKAAFGGAIAICACLLSACSNENPAELEPIDQELSAQQASSAIAAIEPMLDESSQVVAVCGPSTGQGYYSNDSETPWIDDGIRDGRMVFVRGQDDSFDMLFRDAGGRYISAAEDGGTIISTHEEEGGTASTWIVFYPSTGVVETHNLTRTYNGWLNLWSSNKPQTVIGPPRLSAFTSNCVIP